MASNQIYDVIVVGGGHAGCEAAHAAARRGASTLLLTSDRRAIARMSCNPAIGGLAKGQIVREIDAMGGLMGRVADLAGIHFRQLNTSKGPAVRSPRAQCDKDDYSRIMIEILENVDNLEIGEAEVDALSVRDGEVRGVITRDGKEIRSRTTVLAAGTFLQGLLHRGDESEPGGRVGEAPSSNLSRSLEAIGLSLRRLKTGTPPRIAKGSIDYEPLEEQQPDEHPRPFSFDHRAIDRPQLSCHITWTTEHTHQIIRDSLHLSPLYAGRIEGIGPRYCPSMEDKVSRFPDRERHQLFLEPEGLRTEWVYVAGLSMSLPPSVQEAILRSIPGLTNCEVLRHAYAVEYDFVPPRQIDASLKAAPVEGLFIAGQLNGTSGYEEAAGQGLMAGINASLHVEGRDPCILARDQAYIGVLIDDLTVLNPTEPYRMFTSRAEHRLLLRSDNADRRLRRLGHGLGIVDDARFRKLEEKETHIAELHRRLQSRSADGTTWNKRLRRPDCSLETLMVDHPDIAPGDWDKEVVEAVEIEVKYEGYIQRALAHVERLKNVEKVKIPRDIDFEQVPSLSSEAKDKLGNLRPETLGQATRVAGVTPADISTLWVFLKRVGAA